MKMNSRYNLINRYGLFIVAILVLFITVVVIQVNYNQNHRSNSTVDEYYTIATIHPNQTPEIMAHRALNGGRVFTYLFYPGALIGMINHMGGNISEETWKYPGHQYFVKNYNTASSGVKSNMLDPNLRNLHYYLTVESAIFMFLTFLPLMFFLWRQKYVVAMFMMAVLIGINPLMLDERSLFYLEPLLVSIINILIWLYLFLWHKKEISWFWLVFTSFIFALAISLKFSCFFLLILIAIMLVFKYKKLEGRLIAAICLILFSLAFFALINWDLFYSKKVFNAIVHDYFSNFYQYATGNFSEISENYKWNNFKRIIDRLTASLGGLVYIFPIILVCGFVYMPRKYLLKWGAFALVILLSIGAIINQRVYMARNLVPFLPAVILITGIMLDNIFRILMGKEIFRLKLRPVYLFVLLFLIIILPIFAHTKNYLKVLLPSAGKNVENVLNSIPNPGKRRLITIDHIPSIDADNYLLTKELPSAPETNGKSIHTYISNTISGFEPDDVVVVDEVKNNKQLTNYILPAIFNENRQFGNKFIFYNDQNVIGKSQRLEELLNSKSAVVLLKNALPFKDEVTIKEVYVIKNITSYTMYLKFEVLTVATDDWIGCRFYFHGKPDILNVNELPPKRISSGYDNWDFSVAKNNRLRYGKDLYIWHDFTPTLTTYEDFTFGIFKGCAKSEDITIKNISLK